MAREAALVELYRQKRLSHYQLAAALCLSRDQTDGLLKRRQVMEDSLSIDEFRAELDAIDRRKPPAFTP